MRGEFRPFYLSLYKITDKGEFKHMAKFEEAKAFLNQVYQAKQVCLRCNADLEELRSTSNLLVPAYGEHTGGSLKHDTSDFICKLQQQEDELERLKLEWLNKRIEVKTFLNQIDMNENIKNVLILRYVSLRKWEEIACAINCSFRWVHTLHSQGLSIVKKKLLH